MAVRSEPVELRVPRPLTRMIGRESELDALLTLLERPDNRLVTITGPGGVGKTRLALHLAATLADEFDREVLFISLAAIRDSDLIPVAIASELGVEPGAPGDAETIIGPLQERTPLLILDNFEQLLDGAPVVAGLVARCPGLQVVVTSRAALDVAGEQRFPLSPLPLPGPDDHNREQVLTRDAVQLFLDRARSVRPDLPLDDQATVEIGEICRRLDGLPLAIELAAARVTILSPKALLARLDRRLQILTSERKGLPERQQTMRDAIAWSYDLLPADEQRLLRTVSVFEGDFPLEAAEALFQASGPAHDAWDPLNHLVSQSLVQAVPARSGETRFRLLETVKAFALEQLETSDGVESSRLAHALYYVDLSEAAEPHLVGAEQSTWLDRLEAEWDNLRAANGWACGTGQWEIPLRIFGAIWWFCMTRGHAAEARGFLNQALAATGDDATALRSRGLLAAGRLAEDQGDVDAARALLGQAAEVARRLGRQEDESLALIGLAHEAHARGDLATGLARLEEAAAVALDSGNRRTLASALGATGNSYFFRGDLVTAQAKWEEALRIVADMGDLQSEAKLLGNLGAIASNSNEFHRAVALQERALVIGRQLNDIPGVAICLLNLAEQHRLLGDLTRAEATIIEGLAHLEGLGLDRYRAQGLHIHAAIALAQGNYHDAANRLYQAIQHFAGLDDHHNLAESIDLAAELCMARGDFGNVAEAMAVAASLRRSAGIDATPFKERELAEAESTVRRALGPVAFRERTEAGSAIAPDAIVGRMDHLIQPGTGDRATTKAEPRERDPFVELTRREREVLQLLVEGKSTREISDALFISPRTTSTHVNNLFGKLEVTSRLQAVALVHRAEGSGHALM